MYISKAIMEFKDRVAKKQAKRERWLKEPVAVIQRPLRFLRQTLTEQRVNEQGQKETFISPLYFMAKDFADAGDGEAVKFMARTVLRQGVPS